MSEQEWAQFAIAIFPWIGLAFVAGYSLRLLQFGRAQRLGVPSELSPEKVSSPTSASPVSPSPEPASPDVLTYQSLLVQERFKSGFLARTAHELRSPINSMVGLHQLILEDLCEDPAEEREFVGQARDAAMKLLQRLDTLIAASKLDSGRERPKLAALSVSDLFRVVENLTLLQATNHNLRLAVTLPDDDVFVLADGRWLRSLLVALVEDAISNTPSGWIKLWCEPDPSLDRFKALYLASDRPFDALADALAASTDGAEPFLQAVQGGATLPPIQLSTPLVLSTAQLMLPPMGGQLELLSGEDGAQLKLSLPSTSRSRPVEAE